MSSERRSLSSIQKASIVVAVLLAVFLLVTATPLGLAMGFPPAVWWAHRLNRWEFDRHGAYYREAAVRISRDMAGVKPGGTLYYEVTPGREIVGLKRLEPATGPAVERLFQDEVLIEAHRYREVFGIRFVTRRPWSGGAFSLIYWDPAPEGSLVWGANPWTDIPGVEWIDSRWWSGYLEGEGHFGSPFYPSADWLR